MTAPPAVTPSESNSFEAQRLAADASTARFETTIDQIRKRSDAWGKGALAVGTAVVSALGIGKIDDLWPQGNGWAVLAVVAGFALSIVGVITVGMRLSKVGNPIVMKTDPDAILGLSRTGNNTGRTAGERLAAAPAGTWRARWITGPVRVIWLWFGRLRDTPSEYANVAAIYERFAKLNGLKDGDDLLRFADPAFVIEATLVHLDENPTITAPVDDGTAAGIRAHITANVALAGTWTPEALDALITYTATHRELARDRAAMIRAELRQVMTNALAAVVSRRMVYATTGKMTRLALVLIPAGIFAALLAANYLEAETPPPPTPPATVTEARAELIVQAAEDYRACLGTHAADQCRPLLETLDALRGLP
ncbi:hypothetical protein [Mycolicibacterium sp.]|uniref:hypothetical protein n=1 Tax=Mycolicibacterium sp. TaxID=2320850 RepID=UPI003D1178CD